MTNTDTPKTGYFYILWNEMFKYYGDDIYKLGKSKNMTKRLTQYVTGYIKHPEVRYLSKQVKNYSLAEQMVFHKLKTFRIAKNREFFKIANLSDTIIIIDGIIDNINNMTNDEMIEASTKLKTSKNKNKIDIKDTTLTEDEFNEFLEQYKKRKVNDKYTYVLNRVQLLNVPDDQLICYKNELCDSLAYQNHINLSALLLPNGSHDNVKVKLVKKLETIFKIKSLDVHFKEYKRKIDFDKALFNEILTTFKTKKTTPTTYKALKQLYVYMLKAVTGVKFINSKKLNTKLERDQMSYSLNEALMKYHSKLLQFRHPELNK